MDQQTELDLARQVRAGDYDRFLCIQLAPAAKRAPLYAVTAFHGELARIAETVSEPLLGHIRLAWWREALEELAAGKSPLQHPVVLALQELLAHHPHIHAQLLRMVEARAMDLDSSLMAEEGAWLCYLDATAGALHSCWLYILNPASIEPPPTCIILSSRAYAMIGLVRAIPYLASHGFLRFPEARMHAANLDSLAPSSAIAALAKPLLDEALEQFAANPIPGRHNKPLRGLEMLSRLHAINIKKNNYDPYSYVGARLSAVLKIMQMKFFLC